MHDPKKIQYGDFMMVRVEDMWFQPRREFIAQTRASSVRGRGGRVSFGRGGGLGGNTEHESVYKEKEDLGFGNGTFGIVKENTAPGANLGKTGMKPPRKRLTLTGDPAASKQPLLLTSVTKVVGLIESIEDRTGKSSAVQVVVKKKKMSSGVQVSPLKIQEKKRHKKDDRTSG